MRATASTKRAIERVKNGETPYAAATAEGISKATLYNALKRLRAEEGVVLEPKPIKQKPTVVNFTVKGVELDSIDKAAAILKTSRSDFVRQAALDKATKVIYFDEHGS